VRGVREAVHSRNVACAAECITRFHEIIHESQRQADTAAAFWAIVANEDGASAEQGHAVLEARDVNWQ
jgi:hypothetical protein